MVLVAAVPTDATVGFSVLTSSSAIVVPAPRLAVEVTLMFVSPTAVGAATIAAGVPAAE